MEIQSKIATYPHLRYLLGQDTQNVPCSRGRETLNFFQQVSCSHFKRSPVYPYSQNDLQPILNGDLFCDTQQLHPLFTVLAAKPDCPTDIRYLAYQAAVEARKEQAYQTVPWELYHDTRNLDKIISDDACCVFFDGHGQLFALDNPDHAPIGNLFEEGLAPLIQRAYPKSMPVPSK